MQGTTIFHHKYIASFIAAVAIAGCSSDKPAPDADASVPLDTGEVDASVAADLPAPPATLRVATFNSSLFRSSAGGLIQSLEGGEDQQARAAAATLQRVRPDIVLLNEFDYDAAGEAADIFEAQYLGLAQSGDDALEFPYRYIPETNTGEASGIDLDQSGELISEPGSRGYGDDAFGFGDFPGQYGMVIYSKYPIDLDAVRTFRQFRWTDMPGNLMPPGFYSDEAVAVFRLSSKNHVDVPINVGGRVVHLLASHPTPPGFDGDEDRNGRRNHDEVRFWADYVSVAGTRDYITDDAGIPGGLAADEAFVIVGDLNCDPVDASSRHEAINVLLDHDRVTDPAPTSAGAVEAATSDGQANASHQGNPALDTADFSDGEVGNLRVDYVLPSSNLNVLDSAVLWPERGSDDRGLLQASDHRLVWVDVEP